jgi:hypothetical protein
LERVRHKTDQPTWERFIRLYSPLLYHWVQKTSFGKNNQPPGGTPAANNFAFSLLLRSQAEEGTGQAKEKMGNTKTADLASFVTVGIHTRRNCHELH